MQDDDNNNNTTRPLSAAQRINPSNQWKSRSEEKKERKENMQSVECE